MTNKDYILVIVPLHRDKRCITGTTFQENKVVIFPGFKNDESIQTGFAGYKITEEKIYTFSPICALVKVESYQSVPSNLVKFASGYVLSIGTKEDCLKKAKENE